MAAKKELDLVLMKRQWVFLDMTKLEIAMYHKCGVTTVERKAVKGKWGAKNDRRKHNSSLKARCLNMLDNHTFAHVERVTGVSYPTLMKWYNEAN